MGNAIVDRLMAANPESTVKVHDLTKHPFPHMEEATLAAFYTPASEQTPATKTALQHSDDAIAELMAADIIVIGAPLWNFSVPSVLKAWIDHIARAGLTFKDSEWLYAITFCCCRQQGRRCPMVNQRATCKS